MSVDFGDIMSQGCPDDVYEATSADEWVECKRKRNFLSMVLGIVVVIVIMIITYFIGGFWTTLVSILTSAFIITGLLVSHFWWIPASARTEFGIFQRNYDSLIRSGKTPAEAYDIIRNEHLTKEIFRPATAAPNPAVALGTSFIGTLLANRQQKSKL